MKVNRCRSVFWQHTFEGENVRLSNCLDALERLEQRLCADLADAGNAVERRARGRARVTLVVKGDGKYLSIAAASILAKTYRDDYMKALHEEYPYYDWSSNKGYPTKKHRAAIREYGTTPYHRMTFNLLGEDSQLELQF